MISLFSKRNDEAARRLQRGVERGLQDGVITDVTPTGGVKIDVRKMLDQPKVRQQIKLMAMVRVGDW